MNRSQAHIRASKFYLCEPLPEDFDELDEYGVMDFIRDHRWQPFEDWGSQSIWELIDDLAEDMLKIHELSTLPTIWCDLKGGSITEEGWRDFCDKLFDQLLDNAGKAVVRAKNT